MSYFKVSILSKAISLTYLNESNLNVRRGSIVSVPLGSNNKIVSGIVLGESTYTPSITYKKIESINFILKDSIRKTIDLISKHNLINEEEAYYNFLPSPSKNKDLNKFNYQCHQYPAENIGDINISDSPHKILCWGTVDRRAVLYLKYINNSNKLILIITPSSKDSENLAIKLKSIGLNKDIYITDNKNSSSIIDIASSNSVIISSDQSSSLLNVDFGLIIIEDESSSSYKRIINSKKSKAIINTKDIAIIRSTIDQTNIILGSYSPSVHTMHIASKYINLMSDNLDKQDICITTNSIFSDHMKYKIQDCIDNNMSVFILFNKKFHGIIVTCIHCGDKNKCKCGGSLLIYNDSIKQLLICNKCSKKYEISFQCKGCGSTSISKSIFNNRNLISWIKSNIENAHIEVSNSLVEKNYDKGKFNIIIGTSKSINLAKDPRTGLSILIYPDQGMSEEVSKINMLAPDVSYSLIGEFVSRSMENNSSLYICSSNEKNMSDIIKNNTFSPEMFYNSDEVQFRESVNFPPFGKIINIKFYSSPKNTEDTLLKVVNEINNFIKEKSKSSLLKININKNEIDILLSSHYSETFHTMEFISEIKRRYSLCTFCNSNTQSVIIE